MDMGSMLPVIFGIVVIVCIALGVAGGYFIARNAASGKLKSAQQEVDRLIADANSKANEIEKTAQARQKELMLEAKEEIIRERQQAETEHAARQQEIRDRENRIIAREESIDKRSEQLDRRERQVSSRAGQVASKERKADELLEQRIHELERISSMTSDEAREHLLDSLKNDVIAESAAIIRESETRARAQADKTARHIISTAIQRYASDSVAELTVTSVNIPSDDLKGRIIGREGRNIRSFEQITGVNLIIDDTPETVVLSSFDPVRREIARVTLEHLIADGRIHPARIEEMFAKAEASVREQIIKAGEQATFDAGIHDMAPELVEILGRLRFRTSYGQNVLKHSGEVAWFCGMMASELGLDPTQAKRAGLLHDIGKAVDHEVEGSHAVIGADLCRRYGERPEIVHAVEAHHNDVEPQTVIANLVIGADAISAARPGSRRESVENYIKRLEKLEEISNAHEGVERTFAMQAGREIRVMVKPEQISDNASTVLAHDIATEIESQMQYPGQIKVVVIRESRSVGYAK